MKRSRSNLAVQGRAPWVRSRSRSHLWTPNALFGPNHAGYWFDPSDLSTLFQDVAGSVPVTAPGQSIALMKNKGNGPDIIQSATSSQPILRQDANGRLLLRFDGLDDSLWSSSAVDILIRARGGNPSIFGMAVATRATTVGRFIAAERSSTDSRPLWMWGRGASANAYQWDTIVRNSDSERQRISPSDVLSATPSWYTHDYPLIGGSVYFGTKYASGVMYADDSATLLPIGTGGLNRFGLACSVGLSDAIAAFGFIDFYGLVISSGLGVSEHRPSLDEFLKTKVLGL